MLINLSNHPSSGWSDEQLRDCAPYGEVVDMPFPRVDPAWGEADVARVADEVCRRILAMEDVRAVHVAGEHTLTFAVVTRLLRAGVCCLTSTTDRIVQDLPDGQMVKTFRFVRLRKYEM